jgi:hypothetical protein
MKDPKSLHLKLQEYADCYSESDAARELKEISEKGTGGDLTGDMTDVALKYLSSAILHAIEEDAQKLQIAREGEKQGDCKLIGKKETSLPKPPIGLAAEMMGIVRCITGLEADSGESKLAYGAGRRRKAVKNANLHHRRHRVRGEHPDAGPFGP